MALELALRIFAISIADFLIQIFLINIFNCRYSGGYDLAARRKNATRESTATLKAWLNEHKKNPYPTKGEKIMLAIITKMTLTQVNKKKLIDFEKQNSRYPPFLKCK